MGFVSFRWDPITPPPRRGCDQLLTGLLRYSEGGEEALLNGSTIHLLAPRPPPVRRDRGSGPGLPLTSGVIYISLNFHTGLLYRKHNFWVRAWLNSFYILYPSHWFSFIQPLPPDRHTADQLAHGTGELIGAGLRSHDPAAPPRRALRPMTRRPGRRRVAARATRRPTPNDPPPPGSTKLKTSRTRLKPGHLRASRGMGSEV